MLFRSVVEGDIKKLKTFLNDRLEKNPILDQEDGLTAIHLAAVLGHLNILKWYKEELNCTNINPKNNKGNTQEIMPDLFKCEQTALPGIIDNYSAWPLSEGITPTFPCVRGAIY